MNRSHPFGELLFDPEIEKTARKLNTETRRRKVESSYTMTDDNQDVVEVGDDGANVVIPRMTLRDNALPTLEGPTEQVQYASNFNRYQNGAFSNTYNNTWRNHPNLSWSNNQNVLRPSGFQDQTKFQKPEETRLDKLERLLTQMVEKDHNRDVALKNVERQLGQLAEALTNRNVDSLSSNTEKNPYEHTHAVTLRNGRNLEDEAEKQRQESRRNTNIQEQEDSIVKSHIPEDVPPPVPFPQRLHKKKIDIQFSKFLDMFKKLHINIPFAEALEQIPVGKITQLVLKN
ncbi:hypothetical protein LIER_01450 [Lithospermum erythrorhizon]|uniref:Uncharacterized protein n=1 Tax=Lithospermum erythrorhizon TaxID=34254 RepID=A0AAV3NQR2_LITER